MSDFSDKILITTGDPNGIGAEIVIKSLNALNLPEKDVCIISNKKVLDICGTLNHDYDIINVDYDYPMEFGKITAEAGDFAFRCLQKACELKPKCIVTAPLSKEAINLAGHKYNGQTEILEHYLAHDGQKAEMLFVSKDFRVLLLTRHCALKDVSTLLTKEYIKDKIERVNDYFKRKFMVNNPSLALCALNPHAGENGVISSDEDDFILPAVKQLRKEGINITNPLPSDSLFVNAVQNYIKGEKLPYFCYVACYHDQGLIPIKAVASEKTVNMTIGLDILRTSPSHGTAFDIAGKNIARPESMIEAIKYGINY